MSGLVLVEPGELDRRENLPGLHGGPAHRRELVDQRVDRRHEPVAATPSLILLRAATVDAIARPPNGPARGDTSEAHRARRPPPGWISLLPIGHRCLAAPSFSSATGRCRSLTQSGRGLW